MSSGDAGTREQGPPPRMRTPAGAPRAMAARRAIQDGGAAAAAAAAHSPPASVAAPPARPASSGKKRSGPRGKSSPYIGVTQYKRTGMWEAHIWIQGTAKAKGFQRHLGSYETPELAARCYDRAALKLRGEAAEVNFPKEEYETDEFMVEHAKTERFRFLDVLRAKFAIQSPPKPVSRPPAAPKEPRQRRPPAAGQPPAKRGKEGGHGYGGGSGGSGGSASPRSRGAPLQWPSTGPHRVTVHQQALPLEPLRPRNSGRGGRRGASPSLSPSPTPSPQHSWGAAGAFQQYGDGASGSAAAAAAAAGAGGGGARGARGKGPGLVSQPSLAVSEELLIAPVLSGYGQLQELAWPFPLGLGGSASGSMTPPGATPSSRLTPPAGYTPCSSPTAARMHGLHSHSMPGIPETPAPRPHCEGSHGEAALLGGGAGGAPPGAPPPPPLLGPGYGAGAALLGPGMAFNPLLLPGLGLHLREPSMPLTLAGPAHAAAAAGGPVVSLPEDCQPAPHAGVPAHAAPPLFLSSLELPAGGGGHAGGATPLSQQDLLPIPPLADVAGAGAGIPIPWPLA